MIRTNYYLRFLFAMLLTVTGTCVFAQTPIAPVVTHIPKFKPPVVKTYLGDYTGDGTAITVEEGKNIIGLPLKVEDAKHNTYTISSYEFAYKRVGITEDEETGQTSPETDMVADRFTTTPLTAIWVNTIKDTLQKGEEFHFFDIIAKDKQGRLFFAPELKLVMQ
jgi:hypothetical protein